MLPTSLGTMLLVLRYGERHREMSEPYMEISSGEQGQPVYPPHIQLARHGSSFEICRLNLPVSGGEEPETFEFSS